VRFAREVIACVLAAVGIALCGAGAAGLLDVGEAQAVVEFAAMQGDIVGLCMTVIQDLCLDSVGHGDSY